MKKLIVYPTEITPSV